MAATAWVDGLSGNDTTGDGSFGNPYQTVGKGITIVAAEANGSTLKVNVLNTATYTMPANSFDVDIDGHSSSTLTIQGVSDVSETPAMVDVQAPATGDCTFAYIRSVQATTIQGFDVDFTPSVASATAQDFVKYRDTDGGPITIQYCKFQGSAVGAHPAGARNVIDANGTGFNDNGVIAYCYMQNMTGPAIDAQGSTTNKFQMHHCVYEYDGTSPPSFLSFSASANASNDRRFYNNTFYIKVVNAGTGQIANLLTHPGLTGDHGRGDFYDNVLWIDTTHSASPKILNVVNTSETVGSSFSSGSIDYNVWYTGPNVASAAVTEFYDGLPWPTSAPANDTIAYEQADTVLFNDPSSSYSWTPNSSGYTFTIAKDVRLKTELTSGTGGALPGALDAAFVDPSIAAVIDGASVVDPGDMATLTMTFTGDAAATMTNPEVTVTVPTGLTHFSATASSGSYVSGTGLWTMGTIGAGATATLQLTYTVDAGTEGNTLTVSAEITASGGAITLGGTTSDDTTSVAFTVTADSSTLPGSPGRVPFIDVLPTTEPRFLMNVNNRLRTTRNRQRENYVRYDEELHQFAEYRSISVAIATNTSTNINLGGLELGKYLLVESDEQVQVGVNSSTNLLPKAKQLGLFQGRISSLTIKNPSTTDAAQVFVVVVD